MTGCEFLFRSFASHHLARPRGPVENASPTRWVLCLPGCLLSRIISHSALHTIRRLHATVVTTPPPSCFLPAAFA